jgi:hypothetical protein
MRQVINKPNQLQIKPAMLRAFLFWRARNAETPK